MFHILSLLLCVIGRHDWRLRCIHSGEKFCLTCRRCRCDRQVLYRSMYED